ncbi:ATP-binding cassette domain-containing protein [Paractinoplanes rishiriensis]|uniref:ATP-binding cassette domain-containing protein n=1 Tax=Paractinoplanes rishiriensis TaxID=1050105 RepID=UPI001942BB89|nr:ATP-binding cassette domain-containing protein [Actinoplanes rishiriensis]
MVPAAGVRAIRTTAGTAAAARPVDPSVRTGRPCPRETAIGSHDSVWSATRSGWRCSWRTSRSRQTYVVFGYLGPNAAGKSTTIRLLAGLLRPTAGRAEIGGHDVVRQRERAQRLIGYCPATSSVTPTSLRPPILHASGISAVASSKARCVRWPTGSTSTWACASGRCRTAPGRRSASCRLSCTARGADPRRTDGGPRSASAARFPVLGA